MLISKPQLQVKCNLPIHLCFNLYNKWTSEKLDMNKTIKKIPFIYISESSQLEGARCLSLFALPPGAWGLKQQTLTAHSSGGWEAETRVPLVRFMVRALFLACRALPSHCVLSPQRKRERALASPPLLTRALIPSWGSTLKTSPDLNFFLLVPPPNTIASGGWASTYECEGTQTFSP